METRRSAVDPVPATVPDLPEEHQGWGIAGYADGETVPSAESPGWGAQGHVEGAPALAGPTETGERVPGLAGPTGPARSGIDPLTGADPGEEPGPGPHPASVLAGR